MFNRPSPWRRSLSGEEHGIGANARRRE